MSGTPTNRTNITLPAEMSREIFAKMQTESAVMQLARQIELPGKGVEIPVITSDPAAAWVAETGRKPVSNPGLFRSQTSSEEMQLLCMTSWYADSQERSLRHSMPLYSDMAMLLEVTSIHSQLAQHRTSEAQTHTPASLQLTQTSPLTAES